MNMGGSYGGDLTGDILLQKGTPGLNMPHPTKPALFGAFIRIAFARVLFETFFDACQTFPPIDNLCLLLLPHCCCFENHKSFIFYSTRNRIFRCHA